MNKNTKTQLAFVRSADPGIYSSIVSDLKDEFYDLELLCFLIVDCAIFKILVSHNLFSVTNNIQSYLLEELNVIDVIVYKADRWHTS